VPPLDVLPAGLNAPGFNLDSGLLPLEAPAPMIAEHYGHTGTRDLLSIFDPADPIDDQVQIALTVVQNSGAAVESVGHRFGDIRKNGDSAPLEIENEARRATSRLVQNRDIKIEKITVIEAGPDGRELTFDYVNLRAPRKPRARQFQRVV
jgi:hypothetical protein